MSEQVELQPKEKEENIIRISVTPYIKKIIRELSCIKIGEDYIKIIEEYQIAKEALIRGLRMMLVEKVVMDRVPENYTTEIHNSVEQVKEEVNEE